MILFFSFFLFEAIVYDSIFLLPFPFFFLSSFFWFPIRLCHILCHMLHIRCIEWGESYSRVCCWAMIRLWCCCAPFSSLPAAMIDCSISSILSFLPLIDDECALIVAMLIYQAMLRDGYAILRHCQSFIDWCRRHDIDADIDFPFFPWCRRRSRWGRFSQRISLHRYYATCCSVFMLMALQDSAWLAAVRLHTER